MHNPPPFAIPAAVFGMFGLLFVGLYAIELVRPVAQKTDAHHRAESAPAVPPPPPAPAAPAVDLEMKEREIKAEIDRLRFDLEGYRRDFDAAEQREREHAARFKRAGLEQQGRMMGEGVRLGSESLKAGKKVRDTEYRIRTKQQELQDLYKNAGR